MTKIASLEDLPWWSAAIPWPLAAVLAALAVVLIVRITRSILLRVIGSLIAEFFGMGLWHEVHLSSQDQILAGSMVNQTLGSPPF